MEIRKFRYEPRWVLLTGCLVGMLLMSVVVLFVAGQPVRSHGLGRFMVRLGLDARLILNIIGWAGVAFTAAGAFAFYMMRMHGARFVEVGAGCIRAPASALSTKIVDIPYAELKNVSLQKVQSTRFITVQHTSGKIQLANTMFPVKGEFDELLAVLNSISQSR